MPVRIGLGLWKFDPNYRHLLFRGNTPEYIDDSCNRSVISSRLFRPLPAMAHDLHKMTLI
jgi:hypothetical protein